MRKNLVLPLVAAAVAALVVVSAGPTSLAGGC
jgi:hypothetical protein